MQCSDIVNIVFYASDDRCLLHAAMSMKQFIAAKSRASSISNNYRGISVISILLHDVIRPRHMHSFV